MTGDGGPLGEEVFPILTATDLPTALGFYRDLLGGTLTYRFPESGDPAFVVLRFGADSAGGQGGGQIGLGQQEEPGELTNDRVTLWVYVADCDEALARLRAAGVPVAAEPVDQPWGERMAVVRDPDGNQVIVANRN
ncbi:VOC family protein [Micromonospora endolithica]|uniref:Bleomycin resistance protein n=1 Tax=Micromonospora endolithica TaxID=230091 RepID=A0A3A9ZMZ6_9ACTN|nr:VOC family protein [Micromonospora endolithica]RKN49643.1 bleomycin resistance protein [Micromonospora endolithica]TWJ23411.1 putative glyoxalase superfamily protein PhnB [Micromonospora endolithica]